MEDLSIEKVWLTDTAVWIRTTDGREACEKFADYSRLRYATKEQREAYTLSSVGIHWPEIDEVLCFEGFFHEKKFGELYRLFIEHPEINGAEFATRIQMSQNDFMEYVSGAEEPSPEIVERKKEGLREIGRELIVIK